MSVKSEATGEVLRQLTTDTSGSFVATLLLVGTYSVEVTEAGFPVTRFPGIVVRITETTRMTAVLKVSTVTQVVEVQSQVEQVNTTDATTGQSLGGSDARRHRPQPLLRVSIVPTRPATVARNRVSRIG